MNALSGSAVSLNAIQRRRDELFLQLRERQWRHADRMFAALLGLQWALAIGLALWISPPQNGQTADGPAQEEPRVQMHVRRGQSPFPFNELPAALPIPDLDKDQFRQVLVNLVQNAVESIPLDRSGTVAVRAEGGQGIKALQLRVWDDGSGIPEHVLPDIFQPLFTTKTKGTGLGLAIVAGMVERHGGTIRVQSKVGQGTEFTIELPHFTGNNSPEVRS